MPGEVMVKYVMVRSEHSCLSITGDTVDRTHYSTLSHPLTQIDFQADMLAGPAQSEAGPLGLTRSDLV